MGDGVEPSDVGTGYVWMASCNPSQEQLNDQVGYFDDLGYAIFSWQYADDSCQMTQADAAARAKGASVYLPRWDKWTNSRPDIVC